MTEPPIQIEGDVVRGNKTVSQQAGGDIVGRDQYKYEAKPVGIPALHQLPAPPADFTGRQAELAELLKAVHTPGATISGLCGQGGVGKTALALILAHELAPDYRDAQIFLDLQGVTEPLKPDAVMAYVISSFKPDEKLPGDPAQLAATYRTVLHGKRALLLFDNARDDDQVRPLVPPVGCLLLITSRQRFTLPGLHPINLDSLSPEDAKVFLLRIAPHMGSQAAQLAQLCGSLPLALRAAGGLLAASPDLDPEQYVKELQSEKVRLKLVGSKAEGLVISVEASFTLSYEKLAAQTAAIFRAIAVFPADFDASAEEAISEDAGQAQLSDLVRRSLVEYSAKTKRYRLHDLARIFAGSCLSEGERYEAQRRHAAHYKDVLAACNKPFITGGNDDSAGLTLFDLERANILAGQAWAASHSGDDDATAQLTNEYPHVGAFVLSLRLDPSERVKWRIAGLGAARQLTSRVMEGLHLTNLGSAYADLGDPHAAIRYHKQALQIFRDIKDRRREGNVYTNLGSAYADTGEDVLAAKCHRQQLIIALQVDDLPGRANALGNLGSAYVGLGDPHLAIQCYECAMSVLRTIGDRSGEMKTSWNLGLVYVQLGDLEKAIAAMQPCVSFEGEIGHSDAEADAAQVEVLRARLAGRT